MEHMSINTHPEVVPPILYVPVDERTDGELGFFARPHVRSNDCPVGIHVSRPTVDGLGETQRWGVLETKRLPEVQEQTNFDKIEIDRYIEPDARERKAQ